MKSYSYDLHTHSCLSPCGDNDMTPNNIVGMAQIAGCDILAITDHNTCKNAPAIMKVGEQAGLLIVPGMELCVAEEAHIVCLFADLENALAFDEYVHKNMPKVKNKEDVFGEQLIMNENDEVIGKEENLLITASFITTNEVKKLVEEYGGVAYPAHVDRSSYSVIAALGAIPEETGFVSAELTYQSDLDDMCAKNPELSGMRIMRSSDAHYLDTLAGEKSKIHLDELSREALIAKLKEDKRA